ncbi:Putative Mn2+ efflux pump MntP [Amycolatopsis sacchari]|uniref:Putative Mn2+ efflux pump MntP n=1 Tax=Amycolatopsis sacchari TaxID=115433 RepID=A0A1I3QKS9_9PSEU|nr:manganese efflux pump [Amycolatopsis sacchari]SFJ33786.1 Putative Mn2+ efflux pump MntP [Amycolatopsis sacchari]
MDFGILVLAFGLSIDNFRSSIAIGTIPFGWRRAVQIALTFGLWDALAPLVGGYLGNWIGEAIDPVAEYVGFGAMGAYGLYLLVSSLRKPPPDEVDHPWVTLFGMPLSLSVDNLIAGTGLGLVGVSLVLPAITFGVVTVVMSFAGLCLGRVAARTIRIRPDLFSGLSLLGAAILLPLVFG